MNHRQRALQRWVVEHALRHQELTEAFACNVGVNELGLAFHEKDLLDHAGAIVEGN